VRGVDLLFHDGEYTPEEYRKYREYGHTSYIRTLELAMEAGVKYLGLFHLNQDRPDWQMDEIVEDCRRIIQARNSRLKCFAVGCNMAFHL
jgi:ribonuclease BN (tRNA processing enzyme)